MDWKMMQAYVTGSVDENLLLRIEYLVAENRILWDQIKGRVQLSDAERQTLAEIGTKLGKQALEEIVSRINLGQHCPIRYYLGWNRQLAAEKFHDSKQRKSLAGLASRMSSKVCVASAIRAEPPVAGGVLSARHGLYLSSSPATSTVQ